MKNLLLIFFLLPLSLSCRTSGERLTPLNRDNLINKPIYILSDIEFGKVKSRFTLLPNGKISGDLLKHYKGLSWAYKDGIEIYYYEKRIKLTSYLKFETKSTLTVSIYDNYLDTVKFISIGGESKRITYPCIIGKNNIAPVLKERNRRLLSRKEFLKKLPKRLSGGRLGGGYLSLKWGNPKEDVKRKLKNLKLIEEDATTLTFKKGYLHFDCYFYEGVLYTVTVEPRTSRIKPFDILKKKYGRSKIIYVKEDSFLKQSGYWLFERKGHRWYDGYTEIKTESSRLLKAPSGYENFGSNPNLNPRVYYKSVKIDRYLEKIRKKKEYQKLQNNF